MTKQRYEISVKVVFRVEADTEAEADDIGCEIALALKKVAIKKFDGDINQTDIRSCSMTGIQIVPSWSL